MSNNKKKNINKKSPAVSVKTDNTKKTTPKSRFTPEEENFINEKVEEERRRRHADEIAEEIRNRINK